VTNKRQDDDGPGSDRIVPSSLTADKGRGEPVLSSGLRLDLVQGDEHCEADADRVFDAVAQSTLENLAGGSEISRGTSRRAASLLQLADENLVGAALPGAKRLTLSEHANGRLLAEPPLDPLADTHVLGVDHPLPTDAGPTDITQRMPSEQVEESDTGGIEEARTGPHVGTRMRDTLGRARRRLGEARSSFHKKDDHGADR
jgi:hypothetical protein